MNERALLNLCRNQPCYIRLEVCNSNDENSVPAHIRQMGISGMSMKAPPVLVCPACPNCHDAVDRRRYMDMDRDYVLLAHYQGIARWINELWKREIICAGIGMKEIA